MSTFQKAESLETYEDCFKRRRVETKGVTKTPRTDRLLAKQLARADQQRGLCKVPVNS